MSVKLFRRGTARCIGLLCTVLTILLCLYYVSLGQTTTTTTVTATTGAGDTVEQQRRVLPKTARWSINDLPNTEPKSDNAQQFRAGHPNSARPPQCTALHVAAATISTADEFARFDFQPEWMKSKEYWDRTFEARFEQQRRDPARPPLKVVIVPHSHNDPGWLKTYLGYFQSDTRQILNFVVQKMHEYRDMTFIWSEIAFLQLWWDQAHPTKQRALRQLIDQGRFEITTGGWVMTDEANVHVYAMVDQLIEGHQWCRTHLNYTPVTGWSIDPFGHGSTVPYLLAEAGFEGTIIQRIHYAWKQWLAQRQQGDFVWTPAWQSGTPPATVPASTRSRGAGALLTHNMPFDIYSIKHSCGPHPFVCLNFDFRKVPGEYTEYSIKAQFITAENVEAKADLLMEQYARTASLFAHNVALIPVGDDFRYNKEREVDQQYTNYKRLIDYIRAHPERYGAGTEIGFGLPRDYFRAVERRQRGEFATLRGDFFVYADIFTEGRPAYWSGYFATRPMYKMLSRELEANLRGLEVLFTVAYNRARQRRQANALRVFEKNYEKMIGARRNLGLFQHHDAITGTSKAAVMRDYGQRMFDSVQEVVRLQQSAIEMLLQRADGAKRGSEHGFVLAELEREGFNKLARKTPIVLAAPGKQNDSSAPGVGTDFVVYNSLAQPRLEVVTLRTLVPNVEVIDASTGKTLPIQVNPVWNITDPSMNPGNIGQQTDGSGRMQIRVSRRQFEVLFVVRLPALSLRTFTMRQLPADSKTKLERLATVYCSNCTEPNSTGAASSFDVRPKQPGDIQLENAHMRLLFDEQSGFLRSVTHKNAGRSIQCAVRFSAYRSAQFHSGAYLFKLDPNQSGGAGGGSSGGGSADGNGAAAGERDILEPYRSDVRILITSGPVASEVTVVYGALLAHTMRIFSTQTALDRAVYIENDVDFEPPPKNRETDMFMRLVTDIENSRTVDGVELPEFYTDQNGFQFHRRVKVPAVGVEGNYYPITTAAFMQDGSARLTLLTMHAQAAASWEPGQLEVMLDRRTLYDDYRGMGEGVVDSRLARHKFWMLLEEFDGDADKQQMAANSTSAADYAVPSLLANQLSNSLNYPAMMYYIESAGVGSGDPSPAAAQRQLLPDVRLWRGQSLPCDVHLMTLRTLTDPELPLFPSASALLVLQRQGHSCRRLRHARADEDGCSEAAAQEQEAADGGGTPADDGIQLLAGVRVERVQRAKLTGLQLGAEVRSWSVEVGRLEPMEMRTLNVSFAATAEDVN